MRNLTGDDAWFWHAYVYGMRRAFMNDQSVISPIDPDGVWFKEDLAQRAEAFYRGWTYRRARAAA